MRRVCIGSRQTRIPLRAMARVSENPYETPQSSPSLEVKTKTRQPAHRRNLLRVARFFTAVGVFGGLPAGVYIASTLAVEFNFVRTLPTFFPGPSVMGFVQSLLILLLAAAFFFTSAGIRRHDLRFRLPALILSGILMLGFPVFTVFGGVCFYRIWYFLRPIPSLRSETLET